MNRTHALTVLGVLWREAKRQLAIFENAPNLAAHSPKTIRRLTDESEALAMAIADVEAVMERENEL